MFTKIVQQLNFSIDNKLKENLNFNLLNLVISDVQPEPEHIARIIELKLLILSTIIHQSCNVEDRSLHQKEKKLECSNKKN